MQQREGRVDVLINNAGVGGTGGAIEDLTDDQWMQVLGTNLLGPIRCCRAVIPSMRERRSGTIINVSSVAGRMYGMPTTSCYSASKHAVCSLSDSLLAELEGFGINVRCIEPGFFATQVVANATIPAWAGSPYEQMHATVLDWYETSVANAPPPDAVVETMMAAADGTLPADTIHHPIGDDAELFVGGLSQMSYADYRALGKQMIGLA